MSNIVEIRTRPAEVIASVIERLEEALAVARLQHRINANQDLA
jgi:hypothetical protein